MTQTFEVDVREKISPESFRREYVALGRPCILRGAMREWGWSALDALTPEGITERWGSHRLRLGEETMPVSEVINRLQASDPERPAPYPAKLELAELEPSGLPLVEPFSPPHAQPNFIDNPLMFSRRFGAVTEVFLGGPGGNFPYIHWDYYSLNAWINEIYGRKEFCLYSAPDPRCFYPAEGDPWMSSVENYWEPDFERYPMFREVRKSTLILEPGDTLFVPHGTWHSARSLELTVSIAFDQLNRYNLRPFLSEVWTRRRHVKGLALTSYLAGVGALETIRTR